MALHIENRPQWYVECAHLKVSNKAGRGKEGKLPGREFWGRLPGVWRMDGIFLLFLLLLWRKLARVVRNEGMLRERRFR